MKLKLNLEPCRLGGLLALAAILTLAGACERVAPIRTLPSWVRGIYVPMFKNTSFEPAIEEVATRLTQEAFLTDGRVDIVPKGQADLALVVEITDWTSRSSNTTGQRISAFDEITVAATAKLYEPFDMSKPLADLGPIRVNIGANVDPRALGYEAEPDRKERVLRSLADTIRDRVINGFPVTLRDMPAGVTLPSVSSPEALSGAPESVLAPRAGEDAPAQSEPDEKK